MRRRTLLGNAIGQNDFYNGLMFWFDGINTGKRKDSLIYTWIPKYVDASIASIGTLDLKGRYRPELPSFQQFWEYKQTQAGVDMRYSKKSSSSPVGEITPPEDAQRSYYCGMYSDINPFMPINNGDYTLICLFSEADVKEIISQKSSRNIETVCPFGIAYEAADAESTAPWISRTQFGFRFTSGDEGICMFNQLGPNNSNQRVVWSMTPPNHINIGYMAFIREGNYVRIVAEIDGNMITGEPKLFEQDTMLEQLRFTLGYYCYKAGYDEHGDADTSIMPDGSVAGDFNMPAIYHSITLHNRALSNDEVITMMSKLKVRYGLNNNN